MVRLFSFCYVASFFRGLHKYSIRQPSNSLIRAAFGLCVIVRDISCLNAREIFFLCFLALCIQIYIVKCQRSWLDKDLKIRLHQRPAYKRLTDENYLQWRNNKHKDTIRKSCMSIFPEQYGVRTQYGKPLSFFYRYMSIYFNYQTLNVFIVLFILTDALSDSESKGAFVYQQSMAFKSTPSQAIQI